MPEKMVVYKMKQIERGELGKLIEKHAQTGNRADYEQIEAFVNRLLNEVVGDR